MGIVNPGEPPQRNLRSIAEEFDSLWAESRQHAANRPGVSLEELKKQSSKLRRTARLSIKPERFGGIRKGEHCSWPESSKRAG
jgi:hypothetical protein